MSRLVLLLIISSTVFYSNAQILKISKNDLAADTAHVWRGNINLNLNINNRNATPEKNLTYTGIEYSNNVTYLAERHAYMLINALNYFRITGGPLISTGFIHVRTNLNRRNQLSYELFTQVQYDDGRQMPFRFLYGGGLRFEILKKRKGNLYAGVGIMHEHERWKPFTGEALIEKSIWKNTNYLSGTVEVSEAFSINMISYYQGGYDFGSEVFRHRISGDISLNAKITGRLALTTNFTLLFESNPIIDINPVVFSLTNGFQFNF